MLEPRFVMKILCKLGMHKWGKTKSFYQFGSNVTDYQQVCMRCGKVKKWNKVNE